MVVGPSKGPDRNPAESADAPERAKHPSPRAPFGAPFPLFPLPGPGEREEGEGS
jgi:hypothetical protein